MNFLQRMKDYPSGRQTRNAAWVSLVAAVFFNVITAYQLVLSNYPEKGLIGPYPKWWFTFNADELKSHYATLIEQGTMGAFKTVQYLDYGLMISTGALFFFLALIVARKQSHPQFRTVGLYVAILLALSPIMDAVENAILLVILTDPMGISQTMAFAYSSFATAKVVFVSVGLIGLILGFFMLLIEKLRKI